jgi:hypothetical protein
MLRITKRQFVALGSVQRDQFVEAMAARLRERYRVELQKTDQEQVRKFVRAGIEQARVHGLVMRPHVRCYIDLLAIYGPGFDASPKFAWAGRILSDEQLDASAKVAQLDLVQSLLDKAKP